MFTSKKTFSSFAAILLLVNIMLIIPVVTAKQSDTMSPRARVLVTIGGGWIIDQYGDTIVFGFNVDMNGGGEVEKQCPLRVHSIGNMEIVEWTGNRVTFRGDCRVNGEKGYTFIIQIIDDDTSGNSNDKFKISVANPAYPNFPIYTSSTEDLENCEIGGGSITVWTPPMS